MRWILSILIVLLFVLPAESAQTIQEQMDSLQVLADSVRTDSLATLTVADMDTIFANRPKLENNGITFLRDSQDGQWIQVDFAVSTNPGLVAITLKTCYYWILAEGAQAVNVPYRVRWHKTRVKQWVKFVDANVLP